MALHALLFVKDLARLTRFYTNVLAADPDAATATDTWVEFAMGDARLGLHAVPESIAKEIEITAPPAVREKAAVKLLLAVSDVERCDGVIRSSGGVALPRPWGATDYADPEGNVFGIVAR